MPNQIKKIYRKLVFFFHKNHKGGGQSFFSPDFFRFLFLNFFRVNFPLGRFFTRKGDKKKGEGGGLFWGVFPGGGGGLKLPGRADKGETPKKNRNKMLGQRPFFMFWEGGGGGGGTIIFIFFRGPEGFWDVWKMGGHWEGFFFQNLSGLGAHGFPEFWPFMGFVYPPNQKQLFPKGKVNFPGQKKTNFSGGPKKITILAFLCESFSVGALFLFFTRGGGPSKPFRAHQPTFDFRIVGGCGGPRPKIPQVSVGGLPELKGFQGGKNLPKFFQGRAKKVIKNKHPRGLLGPPEGFSGCFSFYLYVLFCKKVAFFYKSPSTKFFFFFWRPLGGAKGAQFAFLFPPKTKNVHFFSFGKHFCFRGF